METAPYSLFNLHMPKVLPIVCKYVNCVSMNECFNNKLYCSSKLCREIVDRIRVVALKLNERQTQNMFNMLSKALKHI